MEHELPVWSDHFYKIVWGYQVYQVKITLDAESVLSLTQVSVKGGGNISVHRSYGT